jgi:hypothetical protein
LAASRSGAGAASNPLSGLTVADAMTQINLRIPSFGGICQRCHHDLFVCEDGRIRCSNQRCSHHRLAHPTGQKLNTIKGVQA